VQPETAGDHVDGRRTRRQQAAHHVGNGLGGGQIGAVGRGAVEVADGDPVQQVVLIERPGQIGRRDAKARGGGAVADRAAEVGSVLRRRGEHAVRDVDRARAVVLAQKRAQHTEHHPQ